MNRADLYAAVWAVLPHAGRTPASRFPCVGVDMDGRHAYAYATDSYTMGVARVDASEDSTRLSVHLSTSEATDLARFVRPGKKTEQGQSVALVPVAGELHVGLIGDDGPTDSAVFDTVRFDGYDRYVLLRQMRRLDALPVDTRPHVFDPDLCKRFAQAKRRDGDRMTFWPRRTGDTLRGCGLVTVGESFVGAVAGMEPDEAYDVLTSFLGETERAA